MCFPNKLKYIPSEIQIVWSREQIASHLIKWGVATSKSKHIFIQNDFFFFSLILWWSQLSKQTFQCRENTHNWPYHETNYCFHL